LVDPFDVKEELGLELTAWGEMKELDAVILAVPHSWYKEKKTNEVLGCLHNPQKAVVADIKGMLQSEEVQKWGAIYWRL
jgi:UDP-N-acetyl-D-galactosamine dehydrogenase